MHMEVEPPPLHMCFLPQRRAGLLDRDVQSNLNFPTQRRAIGFPWWFPAIRFLIMFFVCLIVFLFCSSIFLLFVFLLFSCLGGISEFIPLKVVNAHSEFSSLAIDLFWSCKGGFRVTMSEYRVFFALAFNYHDSNKVWVHIAPPLFAVLE